MTPPDEGRPVLRRVGAALRRALSSDEEPAPEEHPTTTVAGVTPIGTIVPRRRAMVRGTLQTVTVSPRLGTCSLQADLTDGTGTVRLVWMGRRTIAGIEPGRRLEASGMIAADHGGRVMYNPVYELLAGE